KWVIWSRRQFRVVYKNNFRSTSCAGTPLTRLEPTLSPHPMRGEGRVRGAVGHSTIGLISEIYWSPPIEGWSHGVPAQYHCEAFSAWMCPSTNATLLRWL